MNDGGSRPDLTTTPTDLLAWIATTLLHRVFPDPWSIAGWL